MTPERFEQVQALFLAALDRDAADRAAFLDQACATDPALRQEVESLISMHESSDPLLDRTVGAFAAKLLAQGESPVGQAIGAYQVERQIGRGGMGEVYLARDTRLDRPVAIKLLPASFNHDIERVRRFQQEARAASLLNHPHIVTIHEIGEANGRRFIVSELVEGQTLRALLRTGRVKLEQVLDIITQTASALNAAHQAGIIHRDIKPENVMVRKDGYVKVLDFGLAKMTVRASGAKRLRDEESVARLTEVSTETGTVMGTVKYMSPEQARGQKVDQRTDIFSLGVVLYEMITGRAPFDGETPSHTIVAILEHQPPPISEAAPDAPDQLRQVIEKALGKARDERYQTISEMLDDLLEVRSELQVRARQGHVIIAGASDSGGLGTAGVRVTDPLRDLLAVQSGATLQAQTASAAYVVTEIKPRRRRGLLLMGAALIVLAVLSFVIYKWAGPKTARQAPALESMEMTRFTFTGNVFGVISPDGRYAAYVATEENGERNLWIRQVVGEANLLILPIKNAALWGVAFAPDSNFLYVVLEDVSNPVGGTLYKIPVLGGTPRKLLTPIGGITNDSFSPDGRKIVFFRGTSLVTADADGSNEQTFISFPETSRIWGFAWSPDGQTIAYAMRDFSDADGNNYYLAEKPVGGGPERIIVPRQRKIMKGLVWMPERRGLLTLAGDALAENYQLFLVSYPDGAMRRITQDVNHYINLSATADRKAILLTQLERAASIWVAAMADSTRARKITPSLGPYGAVAWTPDGKLVYNQTSSNGSDLWMMAADGSHARPLTTNAGTNEMQTVTADGRYIVFTSDRNGHDQIWRMGMDGDDPTPLTAGSGWQPQCSPDGVWVIYQDKVADQWGLWKIAMQGGNPVQIAEQVTGSGAISPDGRLLAYEQFNQQAKKYQLVVRPFAGGPPIRVFDVAASGLYGILHWTHDGSGLAYLNGKTVLLQPLSGGPPRALLAWNDDIFWFDLSPDGKQIACVSGRNTSDLAILHLAN